MSFSFWRRAAGAALLALVPTQILAADTQIDASIDYQFDMIAPVQRSGIPVTHRFSITLSGKNQVSESHTASAPGRSFSGSQVRVLGQSGNDGVTGGVWRVAGPNRLVRIRNLPQSVETLTVAVSGATCTITASHRLKPGFHDFKFLTIGKREWFTAAEPRVVSTSCTIR